MGDSDQSAPFTPVLSPIAWGEVAGERENSVTRDEIVVL